MLKRNKNQRGFTLVELLVVVAIILIVSAVAVPGAVNAIRNLRLNGAVSDYANLLQQARLRAVRDNRTYQVHIGNPANNPAPGSTIAWIDVLPANADGSSGAGAGNFTAGDPFIPLSSDVITINNSPTNAALKAAVGNPAIFDAVDPNTPTFGPRGTPCRATLNGFAAYCVTPGQADQFFTIFQSNTNQRIQAVTIDGAGRIQRWIYNGAVWQNQS